MSHFTQADVNAHNARVARYSGSVPALRALKEELCPAGEEIEKLHNPTLKWLKEHGVAYSHNRTDKRSTTNEGVPDFAIAVQGQTVWIEYKTREGKVDPDQQIWHHLAKRQRVEVLVLRSMQEFRDEMRKRGVE